MANLPCATHGDRGGDSLKTSAAALQLLLPAAKVTEVRQTARTSEGLLAKVKLLMLMVTSVVLVSAGSSVAGTMEYYGAGEK